MDGSGLLQGFRLIWFGQQGNFALLAVFVHGWFDAYDMILSAMPTKLQNMQEALSYLEMLQHEVKVLESLINK